MSEIASKASSKTSPSLAQPLVKKGDDSAQEVLFSALFGGVVAAKTDANSMEGGPFLVNAETGSDAPPDVNLDVLAAMQALTAMISGQHGMGRKGELSGQPGKPMIDDSLMVDEDDIVGANPMMIGPMPLQQQNGTSLPAAERSTVMEQMAFEDQVVIPHQHKDWVKLTTPRPTLHLYSVQPEMAALLKSSSLQTMKFAKKPLSQATPIEDIPTGELDIETSHLRSDGRPNWRPDGRSALRPTTYQQNIGQASLNNSKSANAYDRALIHMDGDMQFDSPDDFMRTIATQTERAAGGINGQPVSGESLSVNAVRQMQLGGLSVGAHMSQQNSGQSGGQSGGLFSASAGMTNGSMMDMLDMAQDNWTEMLLQRVERGLAGGKDKIDFHLNPRNLGKMRISLVVQNERTNVHIQTETSAAAQLLSDAEARLAQMMDASGLKFGNLTSQHNQNFSGNFARQNSEQGREDGSAHAAGSATADVNDEVNAENSVEQSENLINMQA